MTSLPPTVSSPPLLPLPWLPLMTPSTTSLAMAWTSELARQEIQVSWLQRKCARLQHNVNMQRYNANLKSYDVNGQGYNVNTNDCHIPRLPNPNVVQQKRRHVARGRNEVLPPEEVAQTWDLDGPHLW
ncbi:hypothetical protein DFH07DRAFT_770885 [Mycena maculata]|uniref:Uncharacterized protein n=1 Tax=Mycena maculata TaxID=230809 RepID=A0AAD7JI38_9AGAR|nr:hypothetical protein DFH07DRAFT_770885 [Mycena maculata]